MTSQADIPEDVCESAAVGLRNIRLVYREVASDGLLAHEGRQGEVAPIAKRRRVAVL